jgi:hypothetical protein
VWLPDLPGHGTEQVERPGCMDRVQRRTARLMLADPGRRAALLELLGAEDDGRLRSDGLAAVGASLSGWKSAGY